VTECSKPFYLRPTSTSYHTGRLLHNTKSARASDSAILLDIVRVINHLYVCMYVCDGSCQLVDVLRRLSLLITGCAKSILERSLCDINITDRVVKRHAANDDKPCGNSVTNAHK